MSNNKYTEFRDKLNKNSLESQQIDLKYREIIQGLKKTYELTSSFCNLTENIIIRKPKDYNEQNMYLIAFHALLLKLVKRDIDCYKCDYISCDFFLKKTLTTRYLIEEVSGNKKLKLCFTKDSKTIIHCFGFDDHSSH